MPRKPAVVLASVARGVLLSIGVTACTPVIVENPTDRALDLAEKWVSLSTAGNEDFAQALACDGAMLGGTNGDGPEVESPTFEVADLGGGDFDVEVTAIRANYPDWQTTLRIETDGELCIKRIE